MAASSPIRRQVFYTGRVQGVGFRWTARHIAQGFAVTGFVKNLEDRRVELVVEGTPAELDRYCAAIAEHFGANIREVAATDGPFTGEFATFEVVH
jgi:acylphosphatase